jgi:thiol:disulfide interchange protein DsbD
MRFILLALSFLVPAGVLSAQPAGEPHTAVSLLANVKSVQPGKPFLLGLRMTMDPGWHTYWKNAGEAGLPPEISWTLPGGIKAGEILWPLPHKYLESGDVLTYGYEKENMLLIPMTADASLSSSEVVIKADVSWLECELVCIPGSGSASITLPVEKQDPSADNAEIFERYLTAIPKPLGTIPEIRVTHEVDVSGLRLIARAKSGLKFDSSVEGRADFYPEASAELEIGRTSVRGSGEEVVLSVPLLLYDRESLPTRIRGVLVYTLDSGGQRSAEIEFALTPEMVSRLRVVGEKDEGSLLDREFILEDSATGGGPLYLYLLFAIAGGLLLNIMPCVLPVIGLKVFGLVKMGGEDHGRVRKLGLLFALGILASFIVLALLVIALKAAGEQVGWGFQFQEPLFIVVMSAVVMAFGLSLFGVFEIQLPASATTGVSDLVTKAGATGSSSLGSFSEGVFATILATPCTAPILGTALGFAFSQPAGIILLMFTAVAAGMALPYLVLTLRPAWMKVLPRPGEWMVTAKQFMGFLMMATLLWLLYVLGKQLGMEAVIWTSAFLLTVGVACWVIGRFATLTASRGRFAASWTIAVLVVLGGWFGFQQPVLEARAILSKGSEATEVDGIPWKEFSLTTLEEHLAAGRGVFIDFTAEWCLTCKVNEKTVLADDEVVEKLKTSGIVSLKADWTSRDPDITRLLGKFGRSGVPLYVVFPAGKPDQPIILPEVITSGIVIEALERAAGS